LYFKRTDGYYENVPPSGGILVYYNRRDDDYEPFPPGFRMIAGNNKRRNSTIPDDDPWDTSAWTKEDWAEEKARERAIGFLCLDYKKNNNERAFARHRFPDRTFLDANCDDGLRIELAFPSCWNGKDVDSDNHMSHVAYDRFIHTGGPCPETHPVRLPSLIFEVVYPTGLFKGKPGEFVFANGDSTGYGYHADFMSGWDPAFLKQALETCKNNHGNIEELPCNIVTYNNQSACKAEYYNYLDELRNEKCAGVIPALCGSEKWNTTPPANPAKPVESLTSTNPAQPMEAADLTAAVASTQSTKPVELAQPIESVPPQSFMVTNSASSWYPPMVAGTGSPSDSAADALTTEAPSFGNVETVYQTVTVTSEVWHTVYDNSKRHVHHARR
jgi:hypothetical protein